MEYIKCPYCGQEQIKSKTETSCIKCKKTIPPSTVGQSLIINEEKSIKTTINKEKPIKKVKWKNLSVGLIAIAFTALLVFTIQGFSDYREQIKDLESEIADLQEEIESLNAENKSLYAEYDMLSNRYDLLSEENSKLKKQIENKDERIEKLQEQNSGAALTVGRPFSSSINGSSTNTSSYNSGGGTVYIAEKGKKFHTYSCHYVKNSRTEIDRNTAIAKGYEPCKVCVP